MTNARIYIGIFFCSTYCILPAITNSIETVKIERKMNNVNDKLEFVMDDLNQWDSIPIYGNIISLEKVVETKQSNNEQKDSDTLLRKIDEFLRSHKLLIRFPSDGSSGDYFGRALGEKNFDFHLKGLTHGASEPRTKLKRIILPILLALKLKAIIVLPIVITLIGLIGIKGLGAGFLAILLSGAVALKALLTPSTSYPARISFSKPYDYQHDYWHRSQEEFINQPYRAWTPEISLDPQYAPYQEIS